MKFSDISIDLNMLENRTVQGLYTVPAAQESGFYRDYPMTR